MGNKRIKMAELKHRISEFKNKIMYEGTLFFYKKYWVENFINSLNFVLTHTDNM